MLTANAWTCASTWTDSDGTEHENRQIWSFDDTGNGYFKLIVRDGDSDPQERQNIRFQWAFTNQSFKVLCINGDAFIDRRYWLIESLTDSGLSAYTSMKDPVIYPGYDRTLLILTATTR